MHSLPIINILHQNEPTMRCHYHPESLCTLGFTPGDVRSMGQEDHLEEEMATHSSILAWEIQWTEWKSGGLQSMEL